MSESALDPGWKWRRRVRWGALICFLGTIVPDNVWTTWGFDGWIYAGAENFDNSKLIGVFSIFGITALFTAPTMLLVATSSLLSHRSISRIQFAILIILFIVTVFVPCYFTRIYNTDQVGGFTPIRIAVLLIFLASAGLCVLHYWDNRKTPIRIFPLGIFPIVIALLAWILLALYSFRVGYNEAKYAVQDAMTITGSYLQLAGWIGWWRVVKNDPTALTAPSPPAPASSTSSPA